MNTVKHILLGLSIVAIAYPVYAAQMNPADIADAIKKLEEKKTEKKSRKKTKQSKSELEAALSSTTDKDPELESALRTLFPNITDKEIETMAARLGGNERIVQMFKNAAQDPERGKAGLLAAAQAMEELGSVFAQIAQTARKAIERIKSGHADTDKKAEESASVDISAKISPILAKIFSGLGDRIIQDMVAVLSKISTASKNILFLEKFVGSDNPKGMQFAKSKLAQIIKDQKADLEHAGIDVNVLLDELRQKPESPTQELATDQSDIGAGAQTVRFRAGTTKASKTAAFAQAVQQLAGMDDTKRKVVEQTLAALPGTVKTIKGAWTPDGKLEMEVETDKDKEDQRVSSTIARKTQSLSEIAALSRQDLEDLLLASAHNGDLELLKMAVKVAQKKKMDLVKGLRDSQGNTLLMRAVAGRCFKVAEWLIYENLANVFVENNAHYIALDFVHQDDESIRELIFSVQEEYLNAQSTQEELEIELELDEASAQVQKDKKAAKNKKQKAKKKAAKAIKTQTQLEAEKEEQARLAHEQAQKTARNAKNAQRKKLKKAAEKQADREKQERMEKDRESRKEKAARQTQEREQEKTKRQEERQKLEEENKKQKEATEQRKKEDQLARDKAYNEAQLAQLKASFESDARQAKEVAQEMSARFHSTEKEIIKDLSWKVKAAEQENERAKLLKEQQEAQEDLLRIAAQFAAEKKELERVAAERERKHQLEHWTRSHQMRTISPVLGGAGSDGRSLSAVTMQQSRSPLSELRSASQPTYALLPTAHIPKSYSPISSASSETQSDSAEKEKEELTPEQIRRLAEKIEQDYELRQKENALKEAETVSKAVVDSALKDLE